jgi:hypothetical protein
MQRQTVAPESRLVANFRFCASFLVLVTVIVTTNCGGGSSRHLISLDVTPKDVEAVAPNGTVQFVANGTFDRDPTTETNLAVQWNSSDSSVSTIN